MADELLFDGLQHRFRPDATVLDELGREQHGVSAVRIFEPDNVFALFVLVNLIVKNGGDPITVREHGVLSDGLPRLPQGALAQLRRNGYLVTHQEGIGTRVGIGQRVREIGALGGPGARVALVTCLRLTSPIVVRRPRRQGPLR